MSSFFREFGQQTQIRDIRRQRPRPAKTYLAGPGASQAQPGPDSDGEQTRPGVCLAWSQAQSTGPAFLDLHFSFLSNGEMFTSAIKDRNFL